MFDLGEGPPNATNAQNVWMGATELGTRALASESSYGMQDIDVDLLGPYTLPVANLLPHARVLRTFERSRGQRARGAAHHRFVADGLHALRLPLRHADRLRLRHFQGDEGSPMRPAVYSSYGTARSRVGLRRIGHNLGMVHEHDELRRPDRCPTISRRARTSSTAVA